MGSTGRLSDNDTNANAFRIWTAPNLEDVTIYVGSGVDTDSAKYLSKGSDGTGYSIVADQDFEITSVDLGGEEKLVGDPVPVAANVRRTRVLKQSPFTSITLRILVVNTKVQLEVF